ncbi:hypothetical protein C4579_02605 [Candidatus Microgenomates bacterium]|nr:MAG: hypothetical protein C4579_02605 [Candidatus Microgenomates bacterium]
MRLDIRELYAPDDRSTSGNRGYTPDQQLLEALRTGRITFHNYTLKYLMLDAQFKDVHSSNPDANIHESILSPRIATISENVQYQLGLSGGITTPTKGGMLAHHVRERTTRTTGLSLAHEPYVDHLANKQEGDRLYHKPPLDYFEDDLDTVHASENLRSIVYLLMLQGQARSRTTDLLKSLEKPSELPPERYWNSILEGNPQKFGQEGVFFCLGYMQAIDRALPDIAKKMYGKAEVIQEILPILKATLFMDTKRAKRTGKVGLRITTGEVRQTVFKALDENNIPAAKAEILRVVSLRPQAFTREQIIALGQNPKFP